MSDDVIRVLLIEDDPVDATHIQVLLSEAPRPSWTLPRFEVEHADRLEEALARLDTIAADKATPIEVVLTDPNLPDSHLQETFAAICAHAPEVPVVVLTERDDQELARQAVRAGARGYLLKQELSGQLLAYALTCAIEQEKNERALRAAQNELERRVSRGPESTRQAEIPPDKGAEASREEALQRSKERYQTILETIEDGYFEVDLAGHFTFFNQAMSRMLRYSKDEMLGMNYREYMSEKTAQRVYQAFNRVYRTGKPNKGFDWKLISKDGTERWVSVSIVLIRDDEGQAAGFRGIARDISERKQIASQREAVLEALEESESRFRAVFETAQDSIFIKDRSLRYVAVNPAMEQLFGLPGSELIGRTDDELFGKEAGAHTREVDTNVLAGEIVEEEDTKPVHGEPRTFHVIKVPVRNESGQVIMLCGIARDITERKRMEEALRQTTERLQILRNVDRAILAAQSPEEIARAALTRLRDVIPYTHASISEIDMQQLRARDIVLTREERVEMPDSDWRSLPSRGYLAETLQKGRVHLVQDTTALTSPSSSEQHLASLGVHAYVSVPMLVQDVLIGTLKLASDTPDFFQPDHIEILQEITASLAVALQQAQLLQQAQKDAETKALLLREVNHRVKNNLDAIIGLLYIERRHAPPEVLPAYQPIMEDLTNRILSLAQVHNLLSDVAWAPLLLSDLAEQIIQTTLETFPSKTEVTLDRSISPVRVTPDQAHHLALIVSELAINTLKHAGVGREAVRISTQITQENGTITFTYQDDGPGYPEEILHAKSHGAGLDIIGRIVRKNLRGKLTLRNNDGAMTEIQFESN